jgi:hypothetical protein
VHAASSWFRSDPRRICVVGVWLSLAGLAVTVAALVTGLDVAGLLAGIVLTACGSWAKVAGRDQFRRNRLSRARAATASRTLAAHVRATPLA